MIRKVVSTVCYCGKYKKQKVTKSSFVTALSIKIHIIYYIPLLVMKRGIKSRMTHVISSSLQDSPYFSSPIRPLPSSNSIRSRRVTRKTQRKKKTSKRDNDTLGSLMSTQNSRMNSPYSESLYSMQSFTSMKSFGTLGARQGRGVNRCVLLPEDINPLEKVVFGNRLEDFFKDISKESKADASDDDSTINLSFANSVHDEDVQAYIESTNDQILIKRNNFVPETEIKMDECNSKINQTNEEESKMTVPSKEAMRKKLKLPNVAQDYDQSPYAENLGRSRKKK